MTHCALCNAPRNTPGCICPLLDECSECSAPLRDHEADHGVCIACAEKYGCEECGELCRDSYGQAADDIGICDGCWGKRPQRRMGGGIRIASRAGMRRAS